MFSEPDALVRACAVHVRRGDYVSLSHIHPNLSPDYYRRAMNLFPKDTPFLVMSDDINWCVNNINFADKDIVFFYNDEINSFRVMSQCEHNIISASSFSWWAAYLNKNPNKRVIAPSVWAFNEPKETIEDRLPPDRERLEL